MTQVSILIAISNLIFSIKMKRFPSILSLLALICFLALGHQPALAQKAGKKTKYAKSDSTRANLLFSEVAAHVSKDEFEEASDKAGQVEEMYRAIYGPESKQMADILHKIGVIAFYQGNVAVVKSSFEKSLNIRLKVLGPKHPDVAASYNNLGSLYYMLGNLVKAASYFESALEIQESVLSNNGTDLAAAYFNLGEVHSRLTNADKALFYHEKSLQISKSALGENHADVAESYKSIGDIYHNLQNFEKAFQYYNQSLIISEAISGNEENLANLYNSISGCLISTGDFIQATIYLEKALSTNKRKTYQEKLNYAIALGNLGSAYENRGDYLKAVDYYLKAMNLHQEVKQDQEAPPSILNNLGIAYNKLGKAELSLYYFTKALELYNLKEKENKQEIHSVWQNMGLVNLQLGEWSTGYQNLTKALELKLQLYGEQSDQIAAVYNGLATYYDKLQDYENAVLYLEKGKTILENTQKSAHPDLATFYCNIGVIKGKQGKSDEGLANVERSLAILTEFYPTNRATIADYYSKLATILQEKKQYARAEEVCLTALNYLNYTVQVPLDSVTHLEELTLLLKQLGHLNLEYGVSSAELSRIKKAQYWFNQASNAHREYSRRTGQQFNSSLTPIALEIAEGAIATNEQLFQRTDSIHYRRQSFDFAERAKAFQMFEAMKNVDALQIAGIPDSLLQKEYGLRVDMAYYDKKRQEKLQSGAKDTDTTVLIINGKIFDLKQQHEALILGFEKAFPQYYQAKYGLQTVSLAEVQAMLLPNQTMLQYLAGDNHIYLFLIQQKHFEVKKIEKDFPLERWVDSLARFGVYGYYALSLSEKSAEKERNSVEAYTQYGQKLYQKLLQPVKQKLTEEIIIVPDGELGYVPFEALLTKAPGRAGIFSSYPYLIYEHRISYSYSATLLKEMRTKQHQLTPEKSVLAMAPFYRGDAKTLQAQINADQWVGTRDSLQTLNASGEEVLSIGNLLKGQTYLGEEATLGIFKQEAPNSRILHLSTHGKADDRSGDYAYLTFSTAGNNASYDKLFARDLYNMNLNADLVVLSACETGIGKLRRGEGIVSLARAFTYAGAKSLITSLWKVDDAKTKDLMIGFYRQLQLGKSRNQALHQAKLDYLTIQKQTGGAALHPFFWAGFILIGDYSTLK
jgi:CHAT domain-containing protein/tetratricopeptide (TPR) repeat protein